MYPCAEAVATESADTLEQLEQPGEQLPAELLQVQERKPISLLLRLKCESGRTKSQVQAMLAF